jgi:hypothetical protein
MRAFGMGMVKRGGSENGEHIVGVFDVRTKIILDAAIGGIIFI